MINKKEAKWKSLGDFQLLVVSREKPLPIIVEKQVTNQNKVTCFWEEESNSSLFDESETFKVSISIQLAELLIKSGVCIKEGKSSDEEDFIKLLAERIAQLSTTAESQQ